MHKKLIESHHSALNLEADKASATPPLPPLPSIFQLYLKPADIKERGCHLLLWVQHRSQLRMKPSTHQLPMLSDGLGGFGSFYHLEKSFHSENTSLLHKKQSKTILHPSRVLGSGHLRHWVTWGRLHIRHRLWVKAPSPMGVTAFWQTPGPKMLLWNITLSGSGNKPSIHFQHLFSK